MRRQIGAGRQFVIEQVEPRFLLTVFAPDVSFNQDVPGPFTIPGPFDVSGIVPKSTTSTSVIPVSKGRFLVTGFVQQAGDGGDTYEIVARVFANGTLDKSYGHNGKLAFFTGNSLSVTGNGILEASGTATGFTLRSFTVNGKHNEAFGGGGDGVADISEFTGGSADATVVHLFDDGSVLTLVDANILHKNRHDIVKTKPDGSLDTSFGNNGILTVNPTGIGEARVYLTGTSLYFEFDHGFSVSPPMADLTRYSADGKTLDTSFGANGTQPIPGFATAVTEQPDGKVLFVSETNSTPALYRLNHDGTADVGFGTNGKITLTNIKLATQGSGTPHIVVDDQNRITVGANGTIFRFSSSGTLDAYPFNGTAPFGGGDFSYDDQGRIVAGDQRYDLEPIAQLDSKGIAYVFGTNDDDTVTVSTVSGGKLHFTLNGETIDLNAADVKGIRMDLYFGATNINAPVDVGVTIQAGIGDDSIVTGDGDDSITTAVGSDTIVLGGGNDTVVAGASEVSTIEHDITGTGGNKTITISDGSTNIALAAGNHHILASALTKTSVITIAGGNNTLNLQGNDSTLTIGGDGDNTVTSSALGNVSIITGDGSDFVDVSSSNAVVHTGGGEDEIFVESNSLKTGPTVFGDAGNDTIKSHGHFNGLAEMHGGDGNDLLVGGASSQTMHGEGGKDTLEGGDGNDYLSGGGNNDKLVGDAGNGTVFAGNGDDSIDGATGDDYLAGQDGRDSIFGGSGDDKIYGGAGSDSIYAQDGNDRVYGDGGNDRIFADYSIGKDTLYGGAGDDTFITKDGQRDLIFGDGGADRATADKIDSLTSIDQSLS